MKTFYPHASAELATWLCLHPDFEGLTPANDFSQFGEDGIIEGIFERIGTTNKAAFEFGAHNGVFLSNTRRLWHLGWTTYLIEADQDKYDDIPQHERVIATCQRVTPEGVDEQLYYMHCPSTPDLGVIDVDVQDYWIWEGMQVIRPRVLMIETNAYDGFPPVPKGSSNCKEQTSFQAVAELAALKGYIPVARNPINAIFVREDVIGDLRQLWTPEQEAPIKLNLGSGEHPLEGYQNLDRKTGQEVFPLAYEDESVEEVRASHILQHFSHWDTFAVLQEWLRVLKPGGLLKVAVPDFDHIASWHLEGADEDVQHHIMGTQVDENAFCKAIFGEQGLREAFKALGLVDVQRWESEIKDAASLPVSLNLQGRKPLHSSEVYRKAGLEVIKENINENLERIFGPIAEPLPDIPRGEIMAVMTLPRLAFTDTMFCCMNVFTSLKITLMRSSGVFWGQGLTAMFERAIKDGVKYILALDYDTVFTADDVRRLYALRQKEGAVIPLQMKREADRALFTVALEEGNRVGEIDRRVLARPLVPITSGHFGLTLLSVEALLRLPKPWFLPVADRNGRWDEEDGKMDEDVHFWHKWREAGNTMFLAPEVVVGHLQMMTTWPDKDLLPYHQFVGEYNRAGKPGSFVWGSTP